MRKFGIPSAALIVTALWLAAPVSAAPAAAADTPFINTTHPARFVVFVVVFLALLWFGIVLYDRISANRRQREFMKFATKLVDDRHGKGHTLTTREAGLLLKKVAEPPKTAPGLTRTLLALGLLMLIGIALIALLVSSASGAADLLKTLVVALTSALTTILGFYFGAKTASDAAPPRRSAATGGRWRSGCTDERSGNRRRRERRRLVRAAVRHRRVADHRLHRERIRRRRDCDVGAVGDC